MRLVGLAGVIVCAAVVASCGTSTKSADVPLGTTSLVVHTPHAYTFDSSANKTTCLRGVDSDSSTFGVSLSGAGDNVFSLAVSEYGVKDANFLPAGTLSPNDNNTKYSAELAIGTSDGLVTGTLLPNNSDGTGGLKGLRKIVISDDGLSGTIDMKGTDGTSIKGGWRCSAITNK